MTGTLELWGPRRQPTENDICDFSDCNERVAKMIPWAIAPYQNPGPKGYTGGYIYSCENHLRLGLWATIVIKNDSTMDAAI